MSQASTTRSSRTYKLAQRWEELFDANPWLEGLAGSSHCENVFCCPTNTDIDWLVLSEVREILYLSGEDTNPAALTRAGRTERQAVHGREHSGE